MVIRCMRQTGDQYSLGGCFSIDPHFHLNYSLENYFNTENVVKLENLLIKVKGKLKF